MATSSSSAASPGTSGVASIDAANGYDTFNQFKVAYGSAGQGNEWHYIIEQSQITKSGFDPKLINNPGNMIPIDAIDHAQISGYYSSIDRSLSSTMRVRDWLAGQSFYYQYNFGMDVLGRYGY